MKKVILLFTVFALTLASCDKENMEPATMATDQASATPFEILLGDDNNLTSKSPAVTDRHIIAVIGDNDSWARGFHEITEKEILGGSIIIITYASNDDPTKGLKIRFDFSDELFDYIQEGTFNKYGELEPETVYYPTHGGHGEIHSTEWNNQTWLGYQGRATLYTLGQKSVMDDFNVIFTW